MRSNPCSLLLRARPSPRLHLLAVVWLASSVNQRSVGVIWITSIVFFPISSLFRCKSLIDRSSWKSILNFQIKGLLVMAVQLWFNAT
ncbi:hypothetical protein Ahy_A09g044886 isoform C [Arachis hypogaea]|uniref:Uncharacterized protein n=1 Tax=Arachis hypogaea TaxID=3818 RepID=A0A445BL14_ARAHY|nr:hypothetical protein Ahy_A09g044886 isoform C [Arachis hypogaea]